MACRARLRAQGGVLLAVAFLSGPVRAADSTSDLVRKAHVALAAWDLPGAQAILDVLKRQGLANAGGFPAGVSGGAGGEVRAATPGDVAPNVQFLDAVVEFHRGNHAIARRHLDAVSAGTETGRGIEALILGAAKTTEGYVEERSAAGHFRIRYPPGPDAILAPLALEALEKSRAAVGAALDFLSPEEITVEVLRDAAALAAMTGLSVDEIEATGTIAVCKYNRLMFISPRALTTGYPWPDTLGHEYTHYVTSRKTADRVEVWLHEVLSKMHESAWRGRPAALRPDHEGIIAQAVRDGKLISFAQMSPSMAKLPDQNAASLAFAEVFSAGVFFAERGGNGVFARMLSAIAAGGGMQGGIRAAGFESMDDFEKQWKVWLMARYGKKAPVERQFYRARFKKPGDTGSGRQEDAGDPSARNFLRLGDLLLARGRPVAAADEYAKASSAAGPGVPNPVIQNRLAVARMQSAKLSEAAAALDEVREKFPDHLSTHMNLARIELRRDRLDAAAESFVRALEINPFDPEIWEGLSAIHRAKGDRKAYERDQENLRLIKNPE